MDHPFPSTLIARSGDVTEVENFYQGCSFSPDGLCVLTSTAGDSKLRLYNTPQSCLESGDRTDDDDDDDDERKNNPIVVDDHWTTALVAQGNDTVRSYSWYPFMKSSDPSTCCFAATCRDQPIHLFDAYSGSIRASYRPYNALDEMESPTVVHFSPTGQHIFAGGFRTDRCLHVFDLSLPGRDSTILRLGKTRRSSDGQKGLVSAIEGTRDGRLFAIGTYAPGSIYVYDNRVAAQPSGTILNGVCVVGHGRSHSRKKRRLLANSSTKVPEILDNHEETGSSEDTSAIFSQARAKWFQSRTQGGITHLSFSPDQDYNLYSASRRSDTVLSWDLRMLSGNPDYQSEPIRGIRSYATSSDTNQRLQFDLDERLPRLFIGGLDGCIRCYNRKSGELIGTIGDCFGGQPVNGVSFHRFSSPHSTGGANLSSSTTTTNNEGILVASSGTRHFPSDDDLDEDRVVCRNTTPGRLQMFRLGNGKSKHNP